MPPTAVTARWSLLSKSLSPRSSHCLSITPSGRLLSYGGELKPRTPVDLNEGPLKGSIHLFDLNSQSSNSNDSVWQVISPNSFRPPFAANALPDARVGATTVYENGYLYLWGGRGGVDMSPLEGTQAGLWRANLQGQGFSQHITPPSIHWELLNPQNPDDAPSPRSFHSSVSYNGKIYIHAGCPSSGRLSTLHAFDIASRTWLKLQPAPDPPRGGTALIVAHFDDGEAVLIRYGGFSGYELPKTLGEIDIYSMTNNDWKTVHPLSDPVHGYPGPRSVHGFIPLSFPSSTRSTSEGMPIALLYHGEKDASSLGHAGAGSFWDDVWLLKHRLQTSPSDSAWQWERVSVASKEKPEGRGWFPSAVWNASGEVLEAEGKKIGRSAVVMYGGLVESNERSGEIWSLDVDF